ncbi:Conserved_hypothetical protein [Hexamita inflata]|uniref:Uncharacterized protein n=1 Tax=Hexamita inflata TaxID=28002 RepID=A0AA86PZB1_9EUKA|nr:Conserved hypothetical protein [Hexamita inflata]
MLIYLKKQVQQHVFLCQITCNNIERVIIYFNEQSYFKKQLFIILDKANTEGFEYVTHYYRNANIIYIDNGKIHLAKDIISNIYVLQVENLLQWQHKELISQIVSVSRPQYICEWSSMSYHDFNRIAYQLEQLQEQKTNVVFIPYIYVFNHFSKSITVSTSLKLVLETAFYKAEFPTFEVPKNIIGPCSYFLYVSFHVDEQSYTKISDDDQLLINDIINAKQEYDGIFTLGVWCQTGAALLARKLFMIYGPFHGFGIKTWENLIQILDSRFENYWELENLIIGKPEENYSQRYLDVRQMLKVYDNFYDMYSNHNFDQSDNTPDLKSYPRFSKLMKNQINIFLKQNLKYERVLFVLKILSQPLNRTTITEQNLIDLNRVLTQIRNGKHFDVKLSVLKNQVNDVLEWKHKHKLNNFHIYGYEIEWNMDVFDKDWEEMLGNVKLASNYQQRLFTEMLEIEASSPEEQIEIIARINGKE